MRTYSKFIKPCFDFFFALVLLILLLSLLPAIAISIKLDSPGSIFYIQDRMGKGMRKFKIYKFRTLQQGARELQKKFHQPAEKYITRIGKFLRKTRLDEFPQVINILKGEMSFVGPRANIYENELKEIKVNPERKRKYEVLPGITSVERLISVWPTKKETILSKISNSSTLLPLGPETIDVKLKYDIYYINQQSFTVDMSLLFYTLLFFTEKIVAKGE